jgi:hypothetical protein
MKGGVLFALALALALALPAGAARQTLPRSTVDRPDEVRGPQIHAFYVIPSDGTDRGLDTSGAIESSVHAWDSWLASQTGSRGGFRLDTSGGALDVTFFRDPHSQAEIEAQGAYVRDFLEQDLHDAGFNAPNKIYAVYYDGTSNWSCGGGAYPPTLPGNVAAMYLHGLPNGAVPCDTTTLAPGGVPGYLDFGMVHEIMHTLGFVPSCAPHQTRAGHVSDATNDLMYAGDAPWLLPPTLDVGHDDYFDTGRTDCLDLANSPYLEGNAPPAAPVIKPTPKPAKVPKCKKGQRSSKRKPCRR